MGITDDIRNTLQSKLIIRYVSENAASDSKTACIICHGDFNINNQYCLYSKEEGFVCRSCGERFVPEMIKTIGEYMMRDLDNSRSINHSQQIFSAAEWVDIQHQIEKLLKISLDLSKSTARGIVEAPAGHIGLLYLAKDIVRPEQKENESEKDYTLRVKSYRIQKLQEKIKAETWERIQILKGYFEKLGLPHSTNDD